MKSTPYELSDESLETIVGGTREELNEIIAILKKHNLCVGDPLNNMDDFIESYNNAMALDETTKINKFRLKSVVFSETNPNEYHFTIAGCDDMGPSESGTLVYMLKAFFDE